MLSSIAAAALIDIRYNIVLADNFVRGLDLAGFKLDLKSFYATTRALEIISEASRRLPDELNLRHPHIAWQNIWKTVKESLPPLLIAVEAELAAIDRSVLSLKDHDA